MAKEILIVESDKKDQKEFQRIFQARRYNVVFSESGEQALLRVKLFRPDLIIAGRSLTEKNVLEVCRIFKADPEVRQIPCILFSDVVSEMSGVEGKGALADGIITRPLEESEVLDLADRLLEQEQMKATKEATAVNPRELKSMADTGKDVFQDGETLLLDDLDDLDGGEIIELVDVVEEPEKKMSIDDFVGPEKEESASGITPLESWEKLTDEEASPEKEYPGPPGEKETQAKGFPLQLDEEITLRDDTPEKEFFDKIDLEDILQKVEMLKPALEEELHSQEETAPPSGGMQSPEVYSSEGSSPEIAIPEESSPGVSSYDEAGKEESPDKYTGLAEFEAALKMGVGEDLPRAEIAPTASEELKSGEGGEEAVETASAEMTFEEELLEEAPGEEALKEEVFKEEVLKEEIFKDDIFKEEVFKDEILREEVFKEEPVKEEAFEEKVLQEEVLQEEEEDGIPKSLLDELGEGIGLIQEVEGEEKEGAETGEETLDLLKGLEAAEILPELSEETSTLEEPQVLKEEETKAEKMVVEKRPEAFEKVRAPKEDFPGLAVAERQVEDLISKGVREMMEGFITKLVPELTENILNLTIERIERMVKEVVPEMAEKLIQEEIKRLQSDEKD